MAEASSSTMRSQNSSFVTRWMTALTLIGAAVGTVLGAICNRQECSEQLVTCLGFPGELFVRALKAIVVPMIFASMVSNSAALGRAGGANRIAGMALKFYLSTTFVAALEGVLLFNLFSFLFEPINSSTGSSGGPESSSSDPSAIPSVVQTGVLDNLLHAARDLVPDNIFKAVLEMQLLGVITFASFFGNALSRTRGGDLVIDLFTSCFDGLVQMIQKVVLFTPIGVGSLVAGSIASSHNLGDAMGSIGMMLSIVTLGQMLHMLAFYGLVYWLFTHRNPARYFLGLSRMWLTAFGTSSSAATLSTTCQTCEDLGASRETVNFVCPIGCTVNMDGSALERPFVVLWIALAAAQPVPLHKQIMVALSSTLLSIGSSPIPSAGVSTLVLMIDAAGIQSTPSVQMLAGFVLAIDWLMDRIRTTVNVTGDAIGVAVIDHRLRASCCQDGAVLGDASTGKLSQETTASLESTDV